MLSKQKIRRKLAQADFTDAYGNQFDIELQMTNEHNVAQRSKYYHALMVTHMLTAGEEYQALKETYVIFYVPPVSPMPTRPSPTTKWSQGNHLNDGTHTLILNASGNWAGVSDEGRKAGIKIGERRGKKAGIKEGRKEGRREGRREGTDEAIIKLIPDLVALTNDCQAVINILMKKMDLSQAQAESYYQRAMEKEERG
ncbi:MAG: PD-(D/E)XK nuclease family transposase [Ligilactobacillus agilis]|nr:Rpn family recombination-promoting nuclease/putative transposase [Ligilactobacillus agilis]MDY4065459.1 PD-(D/E)XK nuclease family transposase [Ligilactobacillus agilis]